MWRKHKLAGSLASQQASTSPILFPEYFTQTDPSPLYNNLQNYITHKTNTPDHNGRRPPCPTLVKTACYAPV